MTYDPNHYYVYDGTSLKWQQIEQKDIKPVISTSDKGSIDISDKEAWIRFACAAIKEIDNNDIASEDFVIKKAAKIADKLLVQMKERRF
jgi:hypothetical protein